MDPAVALAERFTLLHDEWLRTGTVADTAPGGGQCTVDLAGAELVVPHLASYDPVVGHAVQLLVAPGVKLLLGVPGIYSGGTGGGGPHTHAESEVTSLIADLAAKASTTHGHPVDQAAGTGSLRTLGSGTLQAAAGDHAHAGGGTGTAIDTAQYSSTGQTIPNTTNAEFAFATADRTITGITRSTRGVGHQFTLAAAGTYAVTVTIRYTNSAAARECYIELLDVTGTPTVVGAANNVQAENYPATINMSVTRYYAASSVICVSAYQSSGASLALDTGTAGWNRINITPVTAGGTHAHPESDITNLATDLAGKAASVHTHAETDVTSLVTDLGNRQPLDADLTQIAAIAPTTDNVIQSVSSAWASRTPTQHQATHPADQAVGTASVRTLGTGATQAAAGDHAHSTYQPLDSDLTAIAAIAPTNDDIIQRKAGAWINRTMAQLRTDIGVDPAVGTGGLRTLGTGAVQAAAGDHTHAAGGLDSDLVDIGALTPANDDVIQRKSGVWVNRTMVQLAADLGVGGGGSPTGPAGGSLAGSYPNPTIAAGAVTGTEIAAAAKDPAVGTAGLRTLGTGAAQAAAGDHLHAATYQPVDTDLTAIAGLTATTNNVIQSVASAWASRTPTQLAATLPADQVAGTASLRTLGVTATTAAAGDHLHAAAYQPLDTDLTTFAGLTATTNNLLQSVSSAWASRTPTQVAATFPADQAAGTASLRTLGVTSTTAAAGDHAHGGGPVASVYQTAVQSIPNNAWTPVLFEAETYDTDNGHSTSTNTSRWTCPTGKAGYYLVSGCAYIGGGTAGVRVAAIAKNGTRLNGSTTRQQPCADGGGNGIEAKTSVVQLAVSDYVELHCLQNNGAAVNTFAGAPETSSLDVAFLRA